MRLLLRGKTGCAGAHRFLSSGSSGLTKVDKPSALASIGVVIMALGFVGCGGGSSSSTQHAAVTTPMPTPSPTPTPTPTPAINAALWVASQQNVQEFLPSQLAIQGVSNQAPHKSTAYGVGQVNGVIFDGAGDLWVIAGPRGTGIGIIRASISEFTVADLSASGNQGPSVSIGFSGFGGPSQGVFDTKGDLWVSDYYTDAIYEYSAAQLAIAGPIVILNLTPNVQLTSNPALNRPVGMVFDAEGNLWVANSGATTIFGFDSAALPTAPGSIDTLTPNVVLSDDGSDSIQAPWALAFDAAGNLWTSNSATPSTLVEFAKSALGSSGSPVPAVTISPTQVAGFASLNAPGGIAFDNLGGLAVGNIGGYPGSISLFSNTQISVSGAPVPDVFFMAAGATTSLVPTGMTFGPIY